MSSLPVEPDPDADVEPDLSPVALRRELRRRVRADHVDPPDGQQRPPVGGRHARRDGPESAQARLDYLPRHSVSTPGPSSVSPHAATEQFARVREEATPAPPPGRSAPQPRSAAPGTPAAGGRMPAAPGPGPGPGATVWRRYPINGAPEVAHPPNGSTPGPGPTSLFDPGPPTGPAGAPAPTGAAGEAPDGRTAIGGFGAPGPPAPTGPPIPTGPPAPTGPPGAGGPGGTASGVSTPVVGTPVAGTTGSGASSGSAGSGGSGTGVVPAESAQPGKRVRVVLSQRKGTPRPVRTVLDVQEMTPVGATLSTSLIRSQLALALRIGGIALIALGSLPAIFVIFPVLGRVELFGLRLPWLLLGGLSYPFMLGLAYLHARSADRLEQVFVDHIQN